MAQEYHGDGDDNGPLHKIDNENVTNRWMEGLLCKEGNGGLGGYEGKKKDDVMVTWDSPFILVAFKTLGLFNIFHMVAFSITNIKGKLENSIFITHIIPCSIKNMMSKGHYVP